MYFRIHNEIGSLFCGKDEEKLKFPFGDHMKEFTVPYMAWKTCVETYVNRPPCRFFNICPMLTDICTGGDDRSEDDCAVDTGRLLVGID